ncbi:MAG: sialate O-acetylesterase [Phycisphaerae bacterium]|nr:sialate O-acetylesterase [Phycisphaerae bacterium]
MKMKMSLLFAVVAVTFVFVGTVFSGESLKVFILAGQSNMQGQGNMTPVTTQGTLEYIVTNDPETYGHIKDGGNWAVRDDVWIYYERDASTTVKGGLTAGCGASSTTIGPELQFGHVMGDYFDGQVLIIKTAWGGKSLAIDFRSPSSGDINDEITYDPPKTAEQQGYYYREMLSIVSDVLGNLSTYFPAYNAADGYEIVGFGWHQGWNDRVDQAHNDQYERNMKNFIKDVRADLCISNLPFVIATTGMTGWTDTHPRALSLMEAQLAMEDFTKYPEFEGNVAVDDTRDYWRTVEESPANQGYHWNRNAETYCLIGNALALEMIDILGDPNAPSVDAGADMITWSGEPVDLDPNVVEKPGSTWTNLTYEWTADPDTGVVFSDDQAPAPSVTITAATDNPTVVTLTLAVNDSGSTEPPVADFVKIKLYDDSCKAARLGLSLADENLTDISGDDCVTNLKDFAELAFTWLNTTSLPQPQTK